MPSCPADVPEALGKHGGEENKLKHFFRNAEA